MSSGGSFQVVFRGYERAAVEELLGVVAEAERAPGSPAAREALERLAARRLMVVLRGYDRRQVDQYLTLAEERLRSLATP